MGAAKRGESAGGQCIPGDFSMATAPALAWCAGSELHFTLCHAVVESQRAS